MMLSLTPVMNFSASSARNAVSMSDRVGRCGRQRIWTAEIKESSGIGTPSQASNALRIFCLVVFIKWVVKLG
jgi:hypothetical protein